MTRTGPKAGLQSHSAVAHAQRQRCMPHPQLNDLLRNLVGTLLHLADRYLVGRLQVRLQLR
eukprot:3911646-Prymnesium_polylepis.1